MRECVSVDLIGDEQAKDGHRDRVIPKPLSQKSDDQPELFHAVSEQVDCSKFLGTDRQKLDGMEEKVSHEIMGIFGELFPGNSEREGQKKLRRNDVCGNYSHDSRECENGFNPQAYLKDQMEITFVKRALQADYENLPLDPSCPPVQQGECAGLCSTSYV
ncbi:hypothetical protein PTKU64_87630 [Paraburkholderia terrae]|uniref:Uncharacterized protein n=1 Tax=Paraburkholderia terrae TaxID=311230 RepID=A0ABM7U272_9BURK|nr:hypothetical protein PTKU64_87630 [Paraburkholderia terrae]